MTAIIPINDDYRIELDQSSWQVSRWRSRKSHPKGGNLGGVSWHRTLQQAGERLVERFISEDDLERRPRDSRGSTCLLLAYSTVYT
jgi:hypothetical protein